ncbi:MAG: DNA mismatch repair endonuclease MutL [Anaerolineales bacterium]|nr:DNA mismatch repair endonuclease MutL [Anaerolineales bacterium]
MTIKVLSEEVASQIAAGEVVERPASVVKELVENSLDAHAHTITIKIEGAGQTLVEVTDDGEGVAADEIAVAVTRHATSKLSCAEDLFRISTLGFRGEALASIASVSQFSICSRQADAEAGIRLSVDGGQVGDPKPTAAPVGTSVSVRNLFYNVPARLKFLKKPATERRLIDGLVTRYALAYPHVRFQLVQDGRLGLQTSGKGDRREVLGFLYGADIARQMLEVISESHDFSLKGYISPISLTRSNRKEIIFFVNGRPVQDIAITTALIQAYHNLLMVGRYPLAYLFLELPAELVDVNVHPTKAEVRFRETDQVFTGIRNAVRRALLAYTPVPEIQAVNLWSSRTWEEARQRRDTFTAGEELTSPQSEASSSQVQSDSSTSTATAFHRSGLLRLVGQVATTYLVAEGPDGLYLIDQHAAHERILFEQYMKQKAQSLPGQALLQPASVQLSPSQARLLSEQLPMLKHLGFQVELFGLNTFLVRSLPGIISHMDPEAALRVLVEDFEEDESPLEGEVEAKIIARVCKRAAIKAGQVLSEEEQRQLITQLEACESPRTCPHGRPTMIHLSVDLLERQFGRRGAR